MIQIIIGDVDTTPSLVGPSSMLVHPLYPFAVRMELDSGLKWVATLPDASLVERFISSRFILAPYPGDRKFFELIAVPTSGQLMRSKFMQGNRLN